MLTSDAINFRNIPITLYGPLVGNVPRHVETCSGWAELDEEGHFVAITCEFHYWVRTPNGSNEAMAPARIEAPSTYDNSFEAEFFRRLAESIRSEMSGQIEALIRRKNIRLVGTELMGA